MIEIRIHGRGGQGGVTLAKIIATIRFLADQIVCGIAINLLAVGCTRFGCWRRRRGFDKPCGHLQRSRTPAYPLLVVEYPGCLVPRCWYSALWPENPLYPDHLNSRKDCQSDCQSGRSV